MRASRGVPTPGLHPPEPARVLVVLGTIDPEVVPGATRSLLRAIPELEARGWRFVYWTAVPGAAERELRAAGAEVYGEVRLLKFSLRELRQPPGLFRRLRSTVGYLHRFDRALRQLAPDAVLGNTVGTLPELAIAHLRGFPTLLHVLEILPGGARHVLGLRVLSWASDEIMVPSVAAGAQIRAIGRVPRVVNTGIEVAENNPVEPQRTRADGGSAIVVGAMGQISRRKGTDVLAAAIAIARRKAPELEFRICGTPIDGAERPRAQAMLEEAVRAGGRYLGRVDPVAELPQWDILVVPSREDPFPNVVLEAMAQGVPVVGSRVGGIPEQLGDAGVLVEPGDPIALAEAIVDLALDPARRARLAHAARQRVSSLFSTGQQADGTERALRAAIASSYGRRRGHAARA